MNTPEPKTTDNSIPSHGHDPARKPFQFNSKDLSPEDRTVLRKLEREAAFNRGYPLAFALGGLTYFAISRRSPKMNTFSKVGLTSMAAVFGNMVGKITYIPTAYKRMESDLSPDSPLRQFMKKVKKECEKEMAAPNASGAGVQQHYSGRSTQQDIQLSEIPASSTTSQDNSKKPYKTYEELRSAHRAKENASEGRPTSSQWSDPYSSWPDTQTSRSGYSEQPMDKPIRHNKYGDPIME